MEIPDTRKYINFQKDGRKHVKCGETRTDDDGNILECTYSARADKHKSRKAPHVCTFKKRPQTNTISQYFNKEELQKADMDLNTLYSKMALLAGQKNLSLEFLTSPEFNDFVCYCMVAGKTMLNDHSHENFFDQSKKMIQLHDRKFFRNIMITTAISVHQLTMADFKILPYCTIAIDEGKDSLKKNLDFIIENPNSRMEPYPYFTLEIEDETAEGYLPLLNQGLGDAELYGIKVGCVIADGNKAQKKCFSKTWERSLRFTATHPFIKQIIFIPCLCHKTNNALVHAFKNDDQIATAIKELRSFGKMCLEHEDDIKAKAPCHITTRWVYDFKIADFIRTHRARIMLFTIIPESIELLYPNLLIYHCIVAKFESTSMMLCQAYPLLKNALEAFDELIEKENPFARQFADSLRLKTLNCDEGGVWLLSYLLTRKGHKENFLESIGQNKPRHHPALNSFHIPPFNQMNDPIEHLFDEENDVDEMNDAQETDDEGVLDDEEEEKSELGKHMSEGLEHVTPEIIQNDGILRDAVVQTERMESSDSPLTKAKSFLREQLAYQGYATQSIITISKLFNQYLDNPFPFKSCETDDTIGFSWMQIHREMPAFRPIADIAMKLHSSPCSEASCERTISTQKLILNLRRQRSSQDLLTARLRLMRARMKH